MFPLALTPATARLIAAGAALAVIGGAWVGGCQYRARQVPGELEFARAEVRKAETECHEGTACAAAADRRALEQAAAVRDAVKAAEDRARAAAAEALAAEQAARERAQAAAAVAQAKQREAEARYQAALATSQECRAWSAATVPCPLQ